MAIEESLSTARLTHRITLGVMFAVALSGLARDDAEPYMRAQRELNAIVEVDFDAYYAAVQSKLDARNRRWSVALERVLQSHGISYDPALLSRDGGASDLCYRPSTLGELAVWLERGPSALSFELDEELFERTLDAELARSSHLDAHVDGLRVTEFKWSSAFGEGLAAGVASFEALSESDQRLEFYLELDSSDARGLVVGGAVPGHVEQRYDPPLSEWLASLDDAPALQTRGADGRMTWLPGLHCIWAGVVGKGTNDAAEWVADRLDEARGKLSLFGVEVPVALTRVLGPFVLLLVAAYLRLHLSHLETIASRAPGAFAQKARLFPWAALYPTVGGRTFAWATLVAFPLLAALSNIEPLQAEFTRVDAWVSVCAVATAAVGCSTAARLDRVRMRIQPVLDSADTGSAPPA